MQYDHPRSTWLAIPPMIAERDTQRTARDNPGFLLDVEHPAQGILGGGPQEV
jgi:hypothetical protein